MYIDLHSEFTDFSGMFLIICVLNSCSESRQLGGSYTFISGYTSLSILLENELFYCSGVTDENGKLSQFYSMNCQV